ncbi:MAG: MFS transporter [Thermoleophilia bacterium]|nr:MFS transporter [Thermoleophilia bacterium]
MPVMDSVGTPWHASRRGAVAAVALSGSALMMGAYATLSIAPIAPLIRADLGISNAGIGLITAAIFGGAALASTPSGHLTDRLGAVRLLFIAMVGIAVTEAIAASASWTWLFVVAMFGVGMAYGCITPPTNVIVRGAADGANQGLVMSAKQIGVTLGGLIAGLTLPALANHYGWRLSLLAPVIGAMVVAGLVVLMHENLKHQVGPRADDSEVMEKFLVRYGWRLGVGGFGFLMAGVQQGFMAYTTLFLTEDHRYGLAIAGVSFAVMMVGGTVGRLGWAVISDRWFRDNRWTGLLISSFVAAFGLLGMAFLPTGPWLWPCFVLVGLSSIGWNGVFLALVANSVPVTHVGRLTGWSLRCVFSGVVVIPPILGFLADHWGWSAAWIFAATITLIAGAGMYFGARGGVNPHKT